jgi:hypothetical protein
MKNILIFLYLSLLQATIKANTEKPKLTINTETSEGSNLWTETDLADYLEDVNKRRIISNKIVMILDYSICNQTNPLNYLNNNIPLKCFLSNDECVLDIIQPNRLTEIEKQYSDEFALKIAYDFFREKITNNNVTQIKFVIFLTKKDFKQEFLKSRKHFSQIFSLFESDFEQLSSSIGIIITKVENDNSTALKQKLVDILQEEKKSISENEWLVFNRIITDDQFEIFSNPINKLDLIKKSRIIERLKFIKYHNLKTRVEKQAYNEEFTDYVNSYYEKYTENFEKALEKSIKNYYITTIDKSISIHTVQNIAYLLERIKDIGKSYLDFESYHSLIIDLLNEYTVDLIEIDLLKDKKNVLDFFIQYFPKNYKRFQKKKEWVKNYAIISDMLNEIKQYCQENELVYNSIDESLHYEGHFINLSQILVKLKDKHNLTHNLSSIKIYTSHSITLDTDFTLSDLNYNKHAPDLILISPNVIVTKLITIDLSCLTLISNYPYGKEKANNGLGDGDNGEDGEPGLHGFNGGKLIVLTNENKFNKRNVNFISIGGQGGPGQEGITQYFTQLTYKRRQNENIKFL